jgi:hypothetical protein
LERTAGLAAQLALFADDSRRPDGLDYAADFISAPVERALIEHVTPLPLQPFQFGQYEGKSRVSSFGWRYDYSLRRLLPADTMSAPASAGTAISHSSIGYSESLWDRLAGSAFEDRPMTPGNVLRSMWRRAIYVMSGPARLDWQHSIPAVEALRYSLTFRTLKANPDILSSDPFP